jgi:hypothetical protein
VKIDHTEIPMYTAAFTFSHFFSSHDSFDLFLLVVKEVNGYWQLLEVPVLIISTQKQVAEKLFHFFIPHVFF